MSPAPATPLEQAIDRIARHEKPIRVTGLRGGARAVVGAHLVHAHGTRPVLFVSASAKAADVLTEDLRAALGEAE